MTPPGSPPTFQTGRDRDPGQDASFHRPQVKVDAEGNLKQLTVSALPQLKTKEWDSMSHSVFQLWHDSWELGSPGL